jgi:hypothetical protein
MKEVFLKMPIQGPQREDISLLEAFYVYRLIIDVIQNNKLIGVMK